MKNPARSLTALFLIFLFFKCGWSENKGLEDSKPFRTIHDISTDHPHNERLLDKYLEYADAYDMFLPKPIKETSSTRGNIRLLEIGVQSGGSILAWKEYYGEHSVIVGIDIDPRCKRSDDPARNIYIEIGSQMNVSFLKEVCKKFGPFDVIIDDGGHTDQMIQTSLFTMFPSHLCLQREKGLYAMEDLHTMMMKKYMKDSHEITHKIVSAAFEAMHAGYASKESTFSSVFQGNLLQMHLFDSLIILVKSVNYSKGLNRIMRGNDKFWNQEEALNPPGTYYERRGR